MLQTLQAGRGVAAVMVVLYHLNGSIWGQPKYIAHQFVPVFNFGNAGVQFFFVLSGFIIFHVHSRDLGNPGALNAFLFKRFSRVFPPYWAALLAVVPVYFIIRGLGTGHETELMQIVSSIFLLPYWEEPILSVAWTLKHEVLFYALFAVCIANLRLGMALLIAWQAACVMALALAPGEFPLAFLLSANNLLFLMGVGAAYATATLRMRHPLWLVADGIAVFVLTGLHSVYADVHFAYSTYVLMFGLASALMVIGLVAIETTQPVHVPHVLRQLGDASYAIYLVHLPVLSAAAKIVFTSGLHLRVPEPLLFLLLFATAIAAGFAFHLFVERPGVRLLKGYDRGSAASLKP